MGEIISLIVAISWTATALFADVASKRLGPLQTNVIRMVLSLVFLSCTMWIALGSPFPMFADSSTWMWLLLSGVVGYVFGDYCLFNSYIIIGSRLGQLFMTLAPPVAAITGYFMLGESLRPISWLAMMITCFGIGLSIMGRGEGGRITTKLPLKGILLGIGAGVGQGVGLVLSKVGMEHYQVCIPEGAPQAMEYILPFASTYIRAIAGAVGFIAMLALRHELGTLGSALKDRKGMSFATLTTICGPFLGVSLSLMAVRYTQAGIASTIMALTPVLIIWPHSLIFKHKASLKEIIGAVISICGVALFFVV